MTTSRGMARISALALAVLLCTACTGSASEGSRTPTTGAAQKSSSASPSGAASSGLPTETSSSSPATSSPSTSAPVSTSPPPQAAPHRTAEELKKALITVDDLPSGWSVEASSDGGGERPISSSTNPSCAGLNSILNSEDLAGSRASATTSFSGGGDGPFVSQRIDALGSAAASKAAVQKIRTAAKGCDAVTLRLPGQGSSKMRISQVSAPDIGGKPYALRFTAKGGALDGLEVTFLWAPVGDVVLSINFLNAYPDEFDGISTDAHSKLTDVLKVSTEAT